MSFLTPAMITLSNQILYEETSQKKKKNHEKPFFYFSRAEKTHAGFKKTLYGLLLSLCALALLATLLGGFLSSLS